MNKISAGKLFFSSIIPIGALFCSGCFYFPGSTNRNDVALPHFSTLKSYFNTKEIVKGFGNIEISFDKEKYRGTFELINDVTHGCRVTFYSLFGGTFGTIIIKNDTGMVSFQGRNIRLSVDKPLDTLGFLWSQHLKMKDWMSLLSGVIPMELFDRPFVPEACIKKGFSKILVYTFESDHIYLHFPLRLSKLKRIILDYSANENPFFIANSNFMDNVPKDITIKADNRNYFKIEYENIVTE
jgi:hypothetical protein